MTSSFPFSARSVVSVLFVLVVTSPITPLANGQAGLREALERLDRNENGHIEPYEITPLARPYLERISRGSRRFSLDDTQEIERILEAARAYYAVRNGVSGRDVRPQGEARVKSFEPDREDPLLPGFGLGRIRYPYNQADLDEADSTLRREDRDRDGYISREEARRARWTHRDPFADDLNRDDRLSRMELTQRYARRRLLEDDSDELRQKEWRVRSSNPRSRRDEERRREDWRSRRGGSYWLAAGLMDRFDGNRDGRLDADEAQRLGIATGRVDQDGDGILSREEVYAIVEQLQAEAGVVVEGLPGWFYEMDADRDGQVALHEFAGKSRKLSEFTTLDENDDGLLTVSEALRAKAVVGGSYRNGEAEVIPPRRTIISEIEVEDDFVIADLNVELSITHTSTGLLDAYLTGPDGLRVELFTEIGGSGDHFDRTVFDDEASTPIVKAKPPYRGSFHPEGRSKKQPSLGHFTGKSVKGVWQLVIRATRNDRFGMLHSWGLTVKPEEEVPTRQPESAEAKQAEDAGDAQKTASDATGN